jgi:major membrane immunogen (membrane-anchored lipoprotein)
MKIIIALALLLTACTDEDKTRRTLEESGFTDITTGGYDFMACSDSDSFHTHFTATNAQGRRVKGTVCCGWIKSCTVRF